MALFALAISSLLIFHLSSSNAFVKPPSPNTVTSSNALTYLSRFGYLDENYNRENMDVIKQAITEFQTFAGLSQTGVLDEETINQMNVPRCGVKDVGHGSNRYKLGDKWSKHSLTYFISIYTSQLSHAQQDAEIAKALKMWSDASVLTFTKVDSAAAADINISFGAGAHGDAYPFDGKGIVVGHAFYPSSGDCHFDDDETWTIDSYSGINLLVVAVHEFGHNMGLDHSDDSDAIMFEYIPGYRPNLALGSDDKAAIIAQYGAKTSDIAYSDPKPSPY